MMKRLLPILVAVNVRRHYGILFAMPLAACAANQDGLGGSTPRYYTQVYQDIGSIYLEPTHTHELALAGLGNLTTADPEFSVIHKDRQFYVSVGEGASETFDIPEDEKSKSWGLLTAEISNLAAERSTFIGQMDPTKRRNLVLDGIANSLDGFSDFYHSNLLAEDRNASIGAAAIKEANGWRLAYVLTDSVAFNAGLRSGDVVIEIDGTATKSLTSDEFIDLVWGKSGSIINLKYLPKGEAKSQLISLARRHHDWGQIESELVGDIAYFKFTVFVEATPEAITNKLKELDSNLDGSLRGMILDLRNNAGGSLSAVEETTGLFLVDDNIARTEGRHADSYQEFKADSTDILGGLPLVLLIGPYTGAGAEVMAAALQDAGRAILLGQRTAGYGMIQTLLRMPDDGYLHLTWAEFVAPSGYHLDQRGVLPNICTADAGLPIEQIIGQLETGERLIDRSTRTMAIDRADTKALTSFSKICASDLTRDSLELELAKALINRPNLLSLARAK